MDCGLFTVSIHRDIVSMKLMNCPGGTVHKPSSREFTYIPQRPYLTTGTFRDQLIYPQSQTEFLGTGKNDQDLYVILEQLHMTHLVEKEGGLDARKEWRDALSGGDKQKIAMARLFYHRPKVSKVRKTRTKR